MLGLKEVNYYCFKFYSFQLYNLDLDRRSDNRTIKHKIKNKTVHEKKK